jgi:hypothetical protein
VLVFTALLAGPLARAQSPVPCSTGSFGGEIGPINISGHFVLPDGCTLDYTGREIIIRGTLEAKDFTLTAAKLTIADTGALLGNGGVVAIDILDSVTLDGSMTVDGSLESKGTHGGGLAIATAGPFSVGPAGRLEASADSMDGSGGFIAVESGGTLSLAGSSSVRTAAGVLGSIGGLVSFASKDSASLLGGIAVGGGLDAGGALIARAALDLETGNVEAGAECEGTDCRQAGSVDLAAGGALTLRGAVRAAGKVEGEYHKDRSAGSVKLDAGGTLSVLGDVDLRGAELGTGGRFEARTDGAYIGSRLLSVKGVGPEAAGGSIEIDAALTAAISGPMEAGGDADGYGGSILVSAEGDVVVRGALEASANTPGAGIELVSRSAGVEVASKIGLEVSASSGPAAPSRFVPSRRRASSAPFSTSRGRDPTASAGPSSWTPSRTSASVARGSSRTEMGSIPPSARAASWRSAAAPSRSREVSSAPRARRADPSSSPGRMRSPSRARSRRWRAVSSRCGILPAFRRACRAIRLRLPPSIPAPSSSPAWAPCPVIP